MYVLNEKAGNTSIVFCSTVATVMKVSYMLRNLGFGAVPLHGKMSQVRAPRGHSHHCSQMIHKCLNEHANLAFKPLRLGALNKFKNRERPILVCTDVASRGTNQPVFRSACYVGIFQVLTYHTSTSS